jgi:hypothetical protein
LETIFDIVAEFENREIADGSFTSAFKKASSFVGYSSESLTRDLNASGQEI